MANSAREEKNLKRRIYDALNVLEAAGMIIKENNIVEYFGQKIGRRARERIGEEEMCLLENKRK